MRRKQLAKRVAIAVLSAATVMTAAPVGAFAAQQTTSIEASDAAVTDASKEISVDVAENVDNPYQLSAADKSTIQNAVKALNDYRFAEDGSSDEDDQYKSYFDTNGALKNDAAKQALTDKVKNSSRFKNLTLNSTDKVATVDNVVINNANDWSVDITTEAGAKFTISVKTATFYALAQDVKNVLDYYFANVVQKTYAGKQPTVQKIADDLTNWASGKGELNGYTIEQVEGKTNTSHDTLTGVSFSGGSAVLGSDGSGVLKVTTTKLTQTTAGTTKKYIGNTAQTLDYNFKVAIDAKSETRDEIVAAALAKISQNTYPSWSTKDDDSDDTTYKVTKQNVIDKIVEDLKAEGVDDATAADLGNEITGVADTAATSTKAGSIARINGTDVLKVALKYSSDQKLRDTDNSIVKALIGAKKSNHTSVNVKTEDPGSLQTIDQKDAAFVSAVKYVYGKNTVLSSKLQKTGSTAYASIDDVVAAVKDQYEAQLKADGVDANGVTVTATAVDPTINTKPVYADPTKANKGDYAVLVTATIPNDFYGWNDGKAYGEKKDETASFLVEVQTVDIEAVHATAIDLKDQTVSLTNKYSATKYGDKKYTIVTLDATMTPEDANDDIAYYVVDKNGDAKDVYAAKDAEGNKLPRTLYDADGNKVILNDNQFAVSEAGVTKVEAVAKVDGKLSREVRDTATVTVTRDSFNDNLDDNKYYKAALDSAKATGIANGVSDNEFGVGQTVTRGQFVTWLYRTAQKTNVKDITIAEPKQVFSDVPTTAYYAAAVEWAKENGVVNGTSATTFSPNDPIKRQDIAVILYNYFGQNAGKGSEVEGTAKFADVASNAYYAKAVTWASKKGVVNGTTATTFNPSDNAKREDSYVMLYRAYSKYSTFVR